MNHQILQPMFALILLTFVVWAVMYVQRFRFIIANKIPPQSAASPEMLNATLPEHINRPSNNLKNLFELPVIFYALCLALFAMQQADALFINLAWAFVLLRAAHSAIHCSVNIVPLRFTAYLFSSIVLWVMALRLALMLI